MNTRFEHFLVASLVPLLGAFTSAQQTLVPQGLLVPVHAPANGGVWAAGDTYKASFHGDFTFVPVLGEYPRVQRFTWRTVGVEVAGQPVPAATGIADRGWTAERYEYVHASGIVEAYDVRAEGVEQTFRVPRPLGAGDLVVRGRIDSELRAPARPFAHGEVLLYDADGNPILSYGAAFAFDAGGRRTPIETAVTGDDVLLRVPAGWLAGATYPVTIDPLLTRLSLAYWAGGSYGRVENIDIGHDPTRASNIVTFDRRVAINDRDVWAILIADTMLPGTSRVLFADLADDASSLDPCVAHVASEDRWIVAYTRQHSIGVLRKSEIAYHVHDGGDFVLRSDFRTLPKPAPADSFQDSHPDVGGSYSNQSSGKAFVVFRRNAEGNYTDNAHSDLVCTTIDMTTKAAGTQRPVASIPSGTTFDREYPAVNQVSYGRADGWFVVYQEWNSTVTSREDWDLNGFRFDADGGPAGGTYTARYRTFTHQLRPVVAGCHNGSSSLGVRYMVGYVTLPQASWPGKQLGSVGEQIVMERVDWPLGSSFSRRDDAVFASSTSPVWHLDSLAYDWSTASHWGASFVYLPQGRVHVATLGFDAGRVEEQVAYTPAEPGEAVTAITFSQHARGFPAAWSVESTSGPRPHEVFTQILAHRTEQTPTTYGTGCAQGGLQTSGRLLSGNEFVQLRLAGAKPQSAGVLMMSFSPASIPLEPIGMPGCWLALDPAQLLLNVPIATDSIGAASLPLPLTTRPVRLAGWMRWQAAYLDPGANARGVVATAGLLTVVR